MFSVLTVRTTLVARDRFLGPGGQSYRAQVTGKLPLIGLEPTMTAGPAEIGHLVIVASGAAHLLALCAGRGSLALRDPLYTLDSRTPDTLRLSELRVELTDGALGAHAADGVEECAGRAGDALIVDDDLPGVTSVALLEGDGAGV